MRAECPIGAHLLQQMKALADPECLEINSLREGEYDLC